MGIGNAPSVTDAMDGAFGDEPGEDLAEALVAHADASTQLVTGHGSFSLGERGQDDLVWDRRLEAIVARRLGLRVDLEVDVLVAGERQGHGLRRGRTAMLGGEQEPAAMASHVEE